MLPFAVFSAAVFLLWTGDPLNAGLAAGLALLVCLAQDLAPRRRLELRL